MVIKEVICIIFACNVKILLSASLMGFEGEQNNTFGGFRDAMTNRL